MNTGYLIAAYAGAILLYGVYTVQLLVRERRLERMREDGDTR